MVLESERWLTESKTLGNAVMHSVFEWAILGSNQ